MTGGHGDRPIAGVVLRRRWMAVGVRMMGLCRHSDAAPGALPRAIRVRSHVRRVSAWAS